MATDLSLELPAELRDNEAARTAAAPEARRVISEAFRRTCEAILTRWRLSPNEVEAIVALHQGWVQNDAPEPVRREALYRALANMHPHLAESMRAQRKLCEQTGIPFTPYRLQVRHYTSIRHD